MPFKTVFIAVVIATGLIVAAVVINSYRPEVEIKQPSAAFVRATGKCAECHRHETAAVVHEFELSVHSAEGIHCLDCHAPVQGQKELDHRGFVITTKMTAGNCAKCHPTEYRQYLKSRHAAPAWAAVRGSEDFTPDQIRHAEQYHPGWVERPPNQLAILEGQPAITKGCAQCHNIGKPNDDGTIGTCTACHARHASSVRLARMPGTCGQCHMGPDHSQMEIYRESKHGALFNAQRDLLNLDADPTELSTRDMFVPTCSTCHMSGLDGMQVTHDPTGRLSYFLFAAVSDKRDHYQQAQNTMKEVCLKCHTETPINDYFLQAEQVVQSTNEKILKVKAIMDELYAENLLTDAPFDEPIEFSYFDLWHYYGRTAKHGAFMGGADFVQWHGNYELLHKTVEIEEMAEQLRHQGATP